MAKFLVTWWFILVWLIAIGTVGAILDYGELAQDAAIALLIVFFVPFLMGAVWVCIMTWLHDDDASS